MKYILPIALTLFSLFVLVVSPLIVKHATAFFTDLAQSIKHNTPTLRGHRVNQGGFVTLLRSYAGYAAGTVVELPTSTEATLVAAGQATVSAGPPTPGAVTTTATSGACAVAAGQVSVIITNSNITVQSIVYAVIGQTTADTTAFNVARVVPGAGLVTIFLNAATTAAVTVDWAILNSGGSFTNPQ